jgi:hypothetical protein
LAHLIEHNNLPVIAVRFSHQVTVTSVSDNLRARVNMEVANAHKLVGRLTIYATPSMHRCRNFYEMK